MREPIRVGIAHRQRLFSECLEYVLSEKGDLKIAGTADTGHETLDLVRSHILDVLILDPFLDQKDGLDVTREIAGMNKPVRTMIYLSEDNWRLAYRYLRAGAGGCTTATCGIDELKLGIRELTKGKVYLPGRIQQEIVEHCLYPNKVLPEEKLTDREFQVLRLIAEGRTNGEISQHLFIGIKTVDTHRSNLLKKLEMRNNADLARFALRHGFISEPC